MLIERGKKKTNLKAVVYGPEGIGKSTLGSRFPSPVFLDVEGGTHALDVARTPSPKSWSAFMAILDEFASGKMDQHGFRTLIVDTADWAEKLLKDSVCAEAGVAAIGDVPFGVLYQKLGAGWGRMLDALTRISEKMHVVLLAHSQLVHCEIPEETGAFDRYELKLNNSFKVSTSAMSKEWANMVLFLNYELMVIETDGKTKAQGGRRVCYTTHHACWDAKNRYGLPEKIRLNEDGSMPSPLVSLLAELESKDEPKPEPAALPAKAPAAAPAPVAETTAPAPAPVKEEPAAPPAPAEPAFSPEKQKLLGQLRELMTMTGVKLEELDRELSKRGIVPAGTHPRQYNEATLTRIVTNWEKVCKNIELNKGA